MSVSYEETVTHVEGHGLHSEGIRPHIMGIGSGLNSFRILVIWYGSKSKWVDLETNKVIPVDTLEALDSLLVGLAGMI